MTNPQEALKNSIENHSIPDGFIKVTDKPVSALTSEQKVILNRKGNVLFNEGKVNEAARIFITTGYSDGLTRVGDVLLKKSKSLEALKYYLLANNKKKSGALLEQVAGVISAITKER